MLLSILLFFTISSSGLYIGKLLTEHPRFALPRLNRLLDRKPFSCRPCLTFHLHILMYGSVAYINSSCVFFIAGFIFSLLIFGGLYIESKKQITK